MSTLDSKTPPVEQPPPVVPLDAGQKNLELAQSLHELAHWIELHAGDIPEMWLGHLHFRNEHIRSESSRAELTAFAVALGDRAAEECDGTGVRIVGMFGRVKVSAGARLADLRHEPPEPEPPDYEPIIKPAPGHDTSHDIHPPVSDAEDDAWRERGWRESSDEPSGTCTVHGDYWTDSCRKCSGYAFPPEGER